MATQVTLSIIDRVPSDSRVYHYDELSDRVKERLPDLVNSNGERICVSDGIATACEPYDVVKFTDYYRITVVEDTRSVRSSC